MFKEKQFNDTVEGLTIFIEKKINNKTYKNVFLRDESTILSSMGTKSSTIIAKSGYMSEDDKNLILLDGYIQKTDKENNINFVKFKKTSFNLSGISTKSISEPKMQETSTLRILQCLLNKKANIINCNINEKTMMNLKIEINKRIGMPFFIPLMALICSFLLGSKRDKKIYQFNKYIYFFVGFAILMLAEITVRYSGNSWSHTAIYYLIPAGMVPLFYFALVRKFKYENLF
jgi:lipopolysaccharide export system permease protein